MEQYLIMAIAVVGITEWVKSFLKKKRKTLYAILPLGISLGVAATAWEGSIGTVLLTWLFVFALATLQYDLILQSVKKLVERQTKT